MIGFTSISAAAFRNVRLTECAGFMPVHHNGTVRQMRTYIKFLVQPESMGSISEDVFDLDSQTNVPIGYDPSEIPF